MTVIYSKNFAPNAGEMPVQHSRIVHSGIWKAGAAAASSSAAGHEADNANHSETYDWWTPNVYASNGAYLQLNLDDDAIIDCVCIAAHNLGACGSEIKVAIRAEDGGTFDESVDFTEILDDSPIMFIFPPTAANAVRVRISEPANPVIARIGVLRVARALQMPRMIYQSASPARFNRTVERITNRSATNEVLGTHVVRKSLTSSYSWSNIDQTFAYGEWMDLMKAADVEPLFIAWRPDPLREYYGDVDYMIEPSAKVGGFTGPQRMSVSLEGSVRAWE